MSQSYLQSLQKLPQEKDLEDLQYVAEIKEQELNAHISATKQSISTLNKERAAMLQSPDLNFESLIEKDKDIAGLTDGLTKLQAYKDQLFPANPVPAQTAEPLQ